MAKNLKFLTWNILAEECIKKRYYPMIRPSILFNRPHRRAQMLDRLKHEKADIMLLQEVMQKEFNSLQEEFGRTYELIQGPFITWHGQKGQSGNVILLKKKAFCLVNKAKAKAKANEEATAIINWPFGVGVRCMNRYNNTPWLILNVHLDDESHSVRLKELESLTPLLNEAKINTVKINTVNNINILLGGDFNQDYKADSRLYEYILNEQGFQTDATKEPTYYIERLSCIDHLFLRGPKQTHKQIKAITNKTSKTWPQINKELVKVDVEEVFKVFGSDHLPTTLLISQ
jgi:endonuclease/exonuclease/phosphatase family metal-dependent hydrolase